MINRTLIRLKVVQALYCHLISRSDFHIYNSPTRNTREAEQSFTLYCSLLALLFSLTGHRIHSEADKGEDNYDNGKRILADNRMMAILASSHELRQLLSRQLPEIENIVGNLTVKLAENIVSSVAYKDFVKKRNVSIEDDILFWTTLLKTTIKNGISSYFKNNLDYSSAAIEKGIDMVVETLKGYSDIRITFHEARKSLDYSLEQSYSLYIGLLYLAVELTREREMQLDAAKNKYLPSHEELNPDTRFIDNRFVKSLKDNKDVENYISKHHIDWDKEAGLLKNLLADIMNSKEYMEYMSKPVVTYSDDCELWRKLFQDVIFRSDALLEALESQSIYWNDDLHIIGTFVIKTVRAASKTEMGKQDLEIFPMFKDEEDRQFGAELFRDTAEHQEEYRSYIDRFIKADWDLERIAFMDVVIMTTAISELLNFPNIPMPVTMNEYTEIAADYSGSNSAKFVNGLLFSVSQELKKEGRIHK